MTQQELAGQELTRGFISQLEKGIVLPSLKSLELVAARLFKPIGFFLEDEPEEQTEADAAASLLRQAFLDAWSGELDHARRLLRRASESADGATLPARLRLALQATGTLLEQAAGEAGAADAERAIAGLRAAGPSPELAQAMALHGWITARRGDATAALPLLEEALGLLSGDAPAANRWIRERLEVALAVVRAFGARPGDALGDLEAAWSRFTRSGVFILPGHVLAAMAACHRSQGRTERAVRLLEQAGRLADVLDDVALKARVHEEMALVAEEREGYPTARQHLDEAMSLWERVKNPGQRSRVLAHLSEVAWRQGRVGEATELAGRALEGILGADERIRVLSMLSRILVEQDRVDEAGARLQEALDVQAGRTPPAPAAAAELAGACSAMGQALRARGDHARAAEYLSRALELYQRAPWSHAPS